MSSTKNMNELTPKTRIVKITYSDPDATDSSSDEEYYNPSIKRSKKITHEIVIQDGKILENKKTHVFVHQPTTKSIHIAPKSSPKNYFVGMRMRKSGRFGAEIGDPFLGKKLWLGTSATREEASMAYALKKREYEEKMKEMLGSEGDLSNEKVDSNDEETAKNLYDEKVDSNDVVEEDGETRVSGDEEDQFGYLNVEQVIDEDGCFVGEFSKIDDEMSIPTSEDGVFLG